LLAADMVNDRFVQFLDGFSILRFPAGLYNLTAARVRHRSLIAVGDRICGPGLWRPPASLRFSRSAASFAANALGTLKGSSEQ
jgi:hypothetical protein